MSSADFGYGNVRLRARATELLSGGEMQQLATLELPDVAAALLGTPYAAALNARGKSAAGQFAAVQATAAARRGDLSGYYGGRAAEIVGLLLARHDRIALLGLLRAARAAPAKALAMVAPTGRIPDQVLRAAAAAPDLPAVVDVLARRAAPDPSTAAGVRRALRGYQLHDDWAAFETATVHAHAAAVTAQVASIRPPLSVRDVLATEVDVANLLAVVRARREDLAGGGVVLLPGGRLGGRMLLQLAGGADPSRLATVVGGSRPEWVQALTAWAGHTDPVRLQDDLEAETGRRLRRRWRSGDPLGPAVPAGYLALVDTEARSLGLLIAAAAGWLDPDAVRRRLAAWTGRSS